MVCDLCNEPARTPAPIRNRRYWVCSECLHQHIAAKKRRKAVLSWVSGIALVIGIFGVIGTENSMKLGLLEPAQGWEQVTAFIGVALVSAAILWLTHRKKKVRPERRQPQ